MNIYLITFPRVYTGGITALYQLCHSLNNIGLNAKIGFPVSAFSKIDTLIHKAYVSYNCKHTSLLSINDNNKTTLIIPESMPNLVDKFTNSIKILYWLSVDHYVIRSFPHSLLDFVRYTLSKFTNFSSPNPMYIKLLYNSYLAHYVSRHLAKLNVAVPNVSMHIVQSRYAYEFLRSLGVQHQQVFFLHEPLEEDYLFQDRSYDGRDLGVAWNSRKAYPITLKIIKHLRKLSIPINPLYNVGKEKMREILSRTKIFIDIGFHPGRDRPPREAVALGNIAVVNNHGGCFYYDDCMIEPPFKVDCYTESRCNIDPKKVAEDILHYMENYEYYYKKFFAKFREYILEEPKLYQKEIEQLARILSDITK
jgi:hypothetical protein